MKTRIFSQLTRLHFLYLALSLSLLATPFTSWADVIVPKSKKIPVGWAVINPNEANGYVLTADSKVIKPHQPIFSKGKPVFLSYSKGKNAPKEIKNNVCTYVGDFHAAENIKSLLVVYRVGFEGKALTVNPSHYVATYETGATSVITYMANQSIADVIATAAYNEPPVKTKIKSDSSNGVNADHFGWLEPEDKTPWSGTAGLVGMAGVGILLLVGVIAYRRRSRCEVD